ncbi:MAG: hypothetical protein U1E66_07175 [Rhodospirillales bacterium]
MTDLFRLVGTLRPTTSATTPATEPGTRPTAEPPPGRPTDARTAPEALKTALKQLDQLLKSGTPARADAHRGTYLNVLV